MAALYELTQQYQMLLELMEDPETDPEVLSDTMEALEGEIEEKAEAYAIIIKKLSAEYNMFDTEMKRCQKNRDVLGNNIKHMKENLQTTMELTGKTKFQTDHFKFSIVKNGGVAPISVSEDVPDEYMRIKKEPDMALIREVLAAGCELTFAHLQERGTHLSIR